MIEDAISGLPPSQECEPPMGVSLLAADWNVFKKSEVKIKWDYAKYGPMVLAENIAYDGKKLYNPINGREWDNFIEHLEETVRRKFAENFPDSNYDAFEENEGYFWSLLLQQWYDYIKVITSFALILTRLLINRIIEDIFSDPISSLGITLS